MAATDTFLRSKAKARASDLWLHPAGAESTDVIVRSGTVTTLATLTSLEALIGPSVSAGGATVPLIRIPQSLPLRPIYDEGLVHTRTLLVGEQRLLVIVSWDQGLAASSALLGAEERVTGTSAEEEALLALIA